MRLFDMPHKEEPLVGHHLIDMVHSHDVVEALGQNFDVGIGALVFSHVLLVGGGVLPAKFSSDQ